MTDQIKAKTREHAALAGRHSSGFDLRNFGLSEDDMVKITDLFRERAEFLWEESVSCFLSDLWHPAEELPDIGRDVIIKDKKGRMYAPYSRSTSFWTITLIALEAVSWAYCDDLNKQ